MLFTTVAALVFPVAIMAVPAQKPATGDDQCIPLSYDLTDYRLTRSPSYASVDFNIKSTYSVNSLEDDAVRAGAICEADGPDLTRNNECYIDGRRAGNLIFDVTGSSGDASYRITHTWKCNNATWASTNNIQLPPLHCHKIEDGSSNVSIKCRSEPIIITPQNVHKLSDEDLKKAAGRAKNATTKPAAKPKDCPSC